MHQKQPPANIATDLLLILSSAAKTVPFSTQLLNTTPKKKTTSNFLFTQSSAPWTAKLSQVQVAYCLQKYDCEY